MTSELEQAVAHQRAGRLTEAEDVYRRVLAAEPDHPEALHLLGVLCAQKGLPEEGLRLIERAIAAKPESGEYHSNRARALHVLGRREAAIAAYRQAVALDGADPQAYRNLGDALFESARFEEATGVYQRALRLLADLPDLHNNLALAYEAQDQLDEAISSFRHALALNAQSPEIQYNLGNALRRKGRLEEASAAYRRALELRPDFAEAHNNLGTTLAQNGDPEAALRAYRRAIALKPVYVEAYTNLGRAFRQMGELTQAVTAFEHALVLDPGYVNAHHNLAVALRTKGQVTQALAAYHRALALERRPDTHSNLLFCMHFDPAHDPQAIFQEAQRWDREHGAALVKDHGAHVSDHDPNRRLRIGYVSPDFRSHSVAYFAEPLLANHDRARFEVCCYANVTRTDAVTTRLQSLADRWCSIVGLTDRQVAEQIRQDRVDVLVDLAGHTANNRLLVFARKPAPIQVTYLGYPGTTGLATMDYRLTDALADPPGTVDTLYSEKLVRLPRGFLSYLPLADGPRVEPLPALSKGHIAFGCFNDATKINEVVISCWSRILLALPQASLILKAHAFTDDETRERYAQRFMAHEIARERVEFLPWIASTTEHLRLYHRVDIALDPFPYNGTTTTCEALWMGVPVITLAGNVHAGRVGASLLTHAGLPELIAANPDDYVKIAATLATDLERLKALRQTLRERLRRSPLMDAAGFTRSLEAAYREMWENYCNASSK